jgi:tight adherence protein B
MSTSPTMLTLLVSLAALVGSILLGAVAVWGFKAYQRHFTEKSEVSLRESFVFIDPNIIFAAVVAAALIVPTVLWFATGSALAAAIGLVAVICLPGLDYRRRRRRRLLDIVLQLPDALTMLSSSMRAGTSLQTALDVVIKETPAPLAQELGVVAREQRLGVAIEDALESMARRLKLEDVDLVVAAMTIAKQVGGNLAETLDRLSATLRAKIIMEGKIRAVTSQGKAQGWIVGALPFFLGGVLWLIEPESMTPLWTTRWGLAVVGVIIVAELIGAHFIKKIVTIDI